eukprot:TRINITY_DN13217_c0_g3_i1.p1 TRINITY_DN13217_c0_g3~~TRINITY_DN13217_c0_g3_i1.p1  ORF type:complete len:176 (+),score=32.10 TRINITY_DN13217_c0_g3_i1:38-529(+)
MCIRDSLFSVASLWLVGRVLVRTGLQVQHACVTAPVVLVVGSGLLLLHRVLLASLFTLGVVSNAGILWSDRVIVKMLGWTSVRLSSVYLSRLRGHGSGERSLSWDQWVVAMTPAELCNHRQVTQLLNREDSVAGQIRGLGVRIWSTRESCKNLILQGLGSAVA